MKLLALVEAIPAAAVSAQALVAYVALTIAVTLVAWKTNRYKSLLKRLRDIPDSDRAQALRDEMGVVLPESISALDWLRSRKQTYFFIAFLAALAVIVIIFSMAASIVKSSGGSVTMQATTDTNKLKSGDSCNIGTIDVAINNNSPSNILLTEVALVPDWLHTRISAGGTDVSATYDVSLNPWMNEALRSWVPGFDESEQGARLEKPLKKKLANAVTVDYGGESISITETVVAQPILVGGIPADKFHVKRGSVDRFKITAAITGAGVYFQAGFHVRVKTDQGTILQSEPLSLYLCTA